MSVVKARGYLPISVLAFAVIFSSSPLSASSVPSSKRSQSDRDVNAIGHRDIVHSKERSFFSLEKEKQVGAQLSAEVERSARVLHDPRVTAYFAAFAQNIARNSDAEMPITITVLDSDEVNACTSPGGYQYVTRGLLLRLESEGELAGLLAHGVAHTSLHLPTRQFVRETLLDVAVVTPAVKPNTNATFTCTSPFPLALFTGKRQADELDADYFGVQYLYKAGYDPDCYVRLVQRVWPVNPHGSPADLFSPFPPVSQRLKALRSEIAEILPQRSESIVSTSAFEELKEYLHTWQMQHPEPTETAAPVLRRAKTDE
jgi:beta-barrel assembly-enhancing protease